MTKTPESPPVQRMTVIEWPEVTYGLDHMPEKRI